MTRWNLLLLTALCLISRLIRWLTSVWPLCTRCPVLLQYRLMTMCIRVLTWEDILLEHLEWES